jgi:hypothetical protein
MPLRAAPLHYSRFGINAAEDLVAALVLDADGARRLAANAPLITDNDNRIATSSVYEKGLGMNGDTSGRILAPYDPLQRADSFIYTGPLREQLSFQYIARRNAVFLMLDPSLADRIGACRRFSGRLPRVNTRACTSIACGGSHSVRTSCSSSPWTSSRATNHCVRNICAVHIHC